MKPANIDVAVLLIFFSRVEQFEKVFEQVKKARPSKLFLYQDGARVGRQDDVEGIQRCRAIVEDIDWECEVYKFYQDKNLGCDPSEFIAQKWAFSIVDKCIVLEDDDVPSQSFFPYCKELLDKYENDERINMICGMNNIGISENIDSSYLFTKKGSIWGWASWSRVLNTWDEHYSWLDNEKALEVMKKSFDSNREFEAYIKNVRKHKESGRAHYESILSASCFLYNRLNIVPKHNMISNIGVGSETTHSVSDVKLLPKRIRKLLYMKTYEIDFPMNHPNYIVRDKEFEKAMTFTQLQSYLTKFESVLLRIRYGDFNSLKKGIKRRLFGKKHSTDFRKF
ncbi:hypothetical protein [Neobacillus drentensis]|uniref:hypothetical protein n=1 Tax=Neobacillus drentensis TaxID=220684 RepID=UPI002FFE0C5F